MKPAEAKTKPSPSPFPPVAAAATLDRTVDALILTILAATATYFVMGTAKYMFFAILVIGTAKVVNSKKNEFELKMVNYVPPSAGVIDVEFEEVVEEVKEEVLEEVSEEEAFASLSEKEQYASLLHMWAEEDAARVKKKKWTYSKPNKGTETDIESLDRELHRWEVKKPYVLNSLNSIQAELDVHASDMNAAAKRVQEVKERAVLLNSEIERRMALEHNS